VTSRPSLLALCLFLSCLGLSQSCLAEAKPPPARFDAGRAFHHVANLVAIGPRPSGSPGMDGPPEPYSVLTFDKAGKTSVYAKR